MFEEKEKMKELVDFYNNKYPEREYNRSFDDSTLKRRTEIVLSILKSSKSKLILDVGGSNGKIADYLNSFLNKRIIITDISKTMLNGQKNECIIADSQNLPFKSKSFGFIYSLQVLEHVPNNNKMLQELSRIAQDELILSTDVCTTESFDFAPQLNNDGHIHMFGINELKDSLKNNGLEIKKVYYPATSKKLWGLINNQIVINWIESSKLLEYILYLIPKFNKGNLEGLFYCQHSTTF